METVLCKSIEPEAWDEDPGYGWWNRCLFFVFMFVFIYACNSMLQTFDDFKVTFVNLILYVSFM